MATHAHVTYTCDVPGCKSRCGLAPEVGDQADRELVLRGWTARDGKHFCPFHALTGPALGMSINDIKPVQEQT